MSFSSSSRRLNPLSYARVPDLATDVRIDSVLFEQCSKVKATVPGVTIATPISHCVIVFFVGILKLLLTRGDKPGIIQMSENVGWLTAEVWSRFQQLTKQPHTTASHSLPLWWHCVASTQKSMELNNFMQTKRCSRSKRIYLYLSLVQILQ